MGSLRGPNLPTRWLQDHPLVSSVLPPSSIANHSERAESAAWSNSLHWPRECVGLAKGWQCCKTQRWGRARRTPVIKGNKGLLKDATFWYSWSLYFYGMIIYDVHLASPLEMGCHKRILSKEFRICPVKSKYFQNIWTSALHWNHLLCRPCAVFPGWLIGGLKRVLLKPPT